MMRGDLEGYLPPEWASAYEPLALLKAGARRQTLLLRERGPEGGRLAVMKRAECEEDHLRNEYELLKALAGPGVPAVYAHLTGGGASYLLREYVEGETLLDYMQKHPKLSAREAAAIGVEVCRVVGRLHAQEPPVVHRDVKAENIIRRRDGSCALIDFGIARRIHEAARRDTELLGTPDVAPPEQFGLRQTAPSADVYALGVLLHELTTGELELNRGRVPGSLRRVVRRCTAIDPSKRYRDAGELERALRKVAARRALPLAACACVAAAVLLAVWTLRPARMFSPSESDVYAFASPAIEAEVCRQLGLEAGSVTWGDLAKVESIQLVGELPFDDWASLRFFGEEVWLDGQTVHSTGDVDTLADIPNFPNLRNLALCGQEIDDLTPLAGCALLRLALCGNEIDDLSPLSKCRELQEVFLSDNPIEDLSPLTACESVWKLNFGATRVSNLEALTEMPNLIYVECHDSPLLEDISALERVGGLWHLSLRPLRPGFLDVIARLTWLENLYIWQPDGELPDLTALSGLTNLRRLFVHVARLGSLRGIEAMARLNYLELYSDTSFDLRPLTSLEELTELGAAHIPADDWTPLASISQLERVLCTRAQAAEIRRQLDGQELRAALVTDS